VSVWPTAGDRVLSRKEYPMKRRVLPFAALVVGLLGLSVGGSRVGADTPCDHTVAASVDCDWTYPDAFPTGSTDKNNKCPRDGNKCKFDYYYIVFPGKFECDDANEPPSQNHTTCMIKILSYSPPVTDLDACADRYPCRYNPETLVCAVDGDPSDTMYKPKTDTFPCSGGPPPP